MPFLPFPLSRALRRAQKNLLQILLSILSCPQTVYSWDSPCHGAHVPLSNDGWAFDTFSPSLSTWLHRVLRDLALTSLSLRSLSWCSQKGCSLGSPAPTITAPQGSLKDSCPTPQNLSLWHDHFLIETCLSMEYSLWKSKRLAGHCEMLFHSDFQRFSAFPNFTHLGRISGIKNAANIDSKDQIKKKRKNLPAWIKYRHIRSQTSTFWILDLMLWWFFFSFLYRGFWFQGRMPGRSIWKPARQSIPKSPSFKA